MGLNIDENKSKLNLDLQFITNLVKDSYVHFNSYNDTFDIFRSKYNIFYVIYINEKKSIISYNLNDNKKINEIKKAHNDNIINLKHYSDHTHSRDLILSISTDDNIKIWDINNIECLVNINNSGGENKGYLPYACLFYDNGQNYILSCNYKFTFKSNESISVLDFGGKIIKKINDSKDNSFFIDFYCNKNLSFKFILTGNKGFCKSYNYHKNILYNKYNDNNIYGCYNNVIINTSSNPIKLIGTTLEGNISIWNFCSGGLLTKIKINEEGTYGNYFWKNNYLFFGCTYGKIKIIDLKREKSIKEFFAHKTDIITIKVINHPKYGECLVSQGDGLTEIKLWKINIYN